MAPGFGKGRNFWPYAAAASLLILLVAGSWIVVRSAGDGDLTTAATKPERDSRMTARTATSMPTASPAPGSDRTMEPGEASAASAKLSTSTDGAINSEDLARDTPPPPRVAENLSASPLRADPGGDAQEPRLPRNWRLCYPIADPVNGGYLFASDDSTAWDGRYSARISSRVAHPAPAGAGFCQVLSAAALKGQRVEYFVHVRTRDAAPGAHIIFRAEGADGRVIAFYNMQGRWISGTSDWTRYAVVIDLPRTSNVIHLGVTLVNTGTLWIDDAGLRPVQPATPLTLKPMPLGFYNQALDASGMSTELRNPGFEETYEPTQPR